MGKRGPAPKGEYLEKSAVLSTRITQDLRDQLEQSVKKSGLTLSREIEHRLRRSFADDAIAVEGYGDSRNRALMRMLALAVQTAWNPERPDANWLEDPWLFDHVVKTLNSLLQAIRPEQPVQPLKSEMLELAARIEQREVAARAWRDVQNADASLPLKAKPARHRLNRLKSDLGEVVMRPKIFYGTADELRRRAAELEKSETRAKGNPTTKSRRGKEKPQ